MLIFLQELCQIHARIRIIRSLWSRNATSPDPVIFEMDESSVLVVIGVAGCSFGSGFFVCLLLFPFTIPNLLLGEYSVSFGYFL